MITQARLKEVVDYNPDTGDFIWKDKISNRIKVDEVAGTIKRNGYCRISIDTTIYMAHRLAFLYVEGSFPKDYVDHINHIKDDNRWCNLRHSTYAENAKNYPRRSDNTSDQVGVAFNKLRNTWAAYITIDGKTRHLGVFKNKKTAILIRKGAEWWYGFHKNHGELDERPTGSKKETTSGHE